MPSTQPSRKGRASLLTLSVALSLANSTLVVRADDTTCAALAPERSELGYRQLANRCEGFYLPQLSGTLRVVSFTVSDALGFTWNEGTILRVTSVTPADHPLNLRAVSLRPNVFYRMDAVVHGNASLSWPISPYLYQRNIRPNQIGVYGWVGDEREKTFWPVVVTEEGTGRPVPSTLTLKLQTVLDLTHFRWTLLDAARAGCGSRPGVDTFVYYRGDMGAGDVISLGLPPAHSAATERCLEIQYRPSDRRWLSETLKIRY
jgi:hypothetical protein